MAEPVLLFAFPVDSLKVNSQVSTVWPLSLSLDRLQFLFRFSSPVAFTDITGLSLLDQEIVRSNSTPFLFCPVDSCLLS
jgi:hypothetical protein